MRIKKPSRFKIIATIIILTAVILSVPLFATPIHETHAATTRTISLVGTINAWNFSTTKPNPTITVAQGDTLTIALTSTDTVHQFYVDVDKNSAADCSGADPCSNFFQPSTPTTFTFQVTFAAGTYQYFCSVHPSTMLGSFIVQGPDYTVSANPSSVSIGQGMSGPSTITVSSTGGFAGTVGLTTKISPSGPTTILNPTSVMLTSGASQASQLTINTLSTTPTGTYTVTVNATSGSTFHTTIVTVMVTNGGPVGAAPSPLDTFSIILPYAAVAVLLLAGTVTVFILRQRAKAK